MKIQKLNEEWDCDYVSPSEGTWPEIKKKLVKKYKDKWGVEDVKITRVKSDTKGLYMYEVETR